MEEKLKKIEEVRTALFRFGGDIVKVATELNLEYDYVLKVRQKMHKDFMTNPEVNLQIAANISREIIKGRNQRKQLIQDMINSLDKREQLWVCPDCNTEVTVITAPDKTITYRCDKCDKIVIRKLIDRLKIYDQKQALIDSLREEDNKLLEWLVMMGWTAQLPPPQPTIINKQNVLVVGSGVDQKVIEEIKHLPALEAEKLRQDLKKEIINIDGQIKDAEQETPGPKEEQKTG